MGLHSQRTLSILMLIELLHTEGWGGEQLPIRASSKSILKCKIQIPQGKVDVIKKLLWQEGKSTPSLKVGGKCFLNVHSMQHSGDFKEPLYSGG